MLLKKTDLILVILNCLFIISLSSLFLFYSSLQIISFICTLLSLLGIIVLSTRRSLQVFKTSYTFIIYFLVFFSLMLLNAKFINQISFWYDEISVFWVLSRGFDYIFKIASYSVVSPPLSYLLHFTWQKFLLLFGHHKFFFQNAEFLLRLPSIFYHILSSFTLYLLLNKINRRQFLTLIISFVYFFHPLFFSYSLEIRFYSLASLMGALQLILFYKLILEEDNSLVNLLSFLSFALLGLYNHLFHSLFSLCLFLIFLVLNKKRKNLGIPILILFILCVSTFLLYKSMYSSNVVDFKNLYENLFFYYKYSFSVYFTSFPGGLFENLFHIRTLFIGLILIFFCISNFCLFYKSRGKERKFYYSLFLLGLLIWCIPLLGILTMAKNYFVHPRHIATFFPLIFYFHLQSFYSLIRNLPKIKILFIFLLIFIFINSMLTDFDSLKTRKLSNKVSYDFKKAFLEMTQENSKIQHLYLDPQLPKLVEEKSIHQLARWPLNYYLPLFQNSLTVHFIENPQNIWTELVTHRPSALLLLGNNKDTSVLIPREVINAACMQKNLNNLKIISCTK